MQKIDPLTLQEFLKHDAAYLTAFSRLYLQHTSNKGADQMELEKSITQLRTFDNQLLADKNHSNFARLDIIAQETTIVYRVMVEYARHFQWNVLRNKEAIRPVNSSSRIDYAEADRAMKRIQELAFESYFIDSDGNSYLQTAGNYKEPDWPNEFDFKDLAKHGLHFR